MDRRVFISIVGGSILGAPLAAAGQQAAAIPRIGFLSASSPSDARMLRFVGAFREGLRGMGYVEGQNIAIEFRWAEGQYDRLPGLAAELVRLKVNVIVTYGVAARAAQQASETIPIVMGGGNRSGDARVCSKPCTSGTEHHRAGVNGTRASREATRDP